MNWCANGMIKNVIFDLGKVLIDTNPSEYLRKYGYDQEKYQALLDAILYDSLWSDMDIGKYDSCKEIAEIYVEKHKELELEIRQFFSEEWMELYAPFEDALKREIKEETNLDFTNPKLFDIKANVHMVYPNKDEVYYTDVVYVINEFWGELKSDDESTELRFFDLDNLPENIMPTQIGYIKRFVEEENKA